MSTGRTRCPRGERGFTFVEVAFSLGLFVLLSFLVERTLTGTHEAERLLNATRTVTDQGHQVSFEIFNGVSASRKLYQDDATGRGYLAALDLTSAPMVTSARLPVIDEGRDLGPDVPGEARTGNVLLFVEEGDSISCVADPSSGKLRHVDAYHFVCIYPSLTTRTVVPADTPALDLQIWRSVPFASLPQILGIDDAAEQRNVIVDLVVRHAHTYSWDPTQDVDAAFFALSALGGLASMAETNPTIAEDVDASGRGRLVYANLQLSRTDPTMYRRRAVFTAAETPPWVPDGFELKIAGASGARKVWIHLVLSSPASRARVVYHPSTMIASTRDL